MDPTGYKVGVVDSSGYKVGVWTLLDTRLVCGPNWIQGRCVDPTGYKVGVWTQLDTR